MLDTPLSQTLEANSTFGPSLEWRAGLLGDLMSDDADARARGPRDGHPRGQPRHPRAVHVRFRRSRAQLPRSALDAGSVVTEPYELAIQAVARLPIIAIDARAPTREKAAKLAGHAAQAVKAKADEPTTPGGRFVVEDISPIRTRGIETGPRKAIAVAVTLLVFATMVRGHHADRRAAGSPQVAPRLLAADRHAAGQRLTPATRRFVISATALGDALALPARSSSIQPSRKTPACRTGSSSAGFARQCSTTFPASTSAPAGGRFVRIARWRAFRTILPTVVATWRLELARLVVRVGDRRRTPVEGNAGELLVQRDLQPAQEHRVSLVARGEAARDAR